MSTSETLASMSPEELIAVIERGLTADEERARHAAAQWDDEDVRYEWEDLPDDVFAHARWHDPSRVLADVESKREIVRRYRLLRGYPERSYDAETLTEEERTRRAGYLHALEVVLADIARPYLGQETP